MSDQPELPPKSPEDRHEIERIHQKGFERQDETSKLTKTERQLKRIQNEIKEDSSSSVMDMAEAQLRTIQRHKVALNTVHEIPENEIIKPEDLRPNTTYEKHGYVYKTDDFGRPEVISGQIKLKEGTRNFKVQSEIGKLGDKEDEGGHLIGTRFDGPADAINLVPQNANLNRGEWKAMENEWAKAAAEGKKVEVQIKPHYYYDDAKRPYYFEVNYKVNGVDQGLRIFENASAKDGGFTL